MFIKKANISGVTMSDSIPGPTWQSAFSYIYDGGDYWRIEGEPGTGGALGFYDTVSDFYSNEQNYEHLYLETDEIPPDAGPGWWTDYYPTKIRLTFDTTDPETRYFIAFKILDRSGRTIVDLTGLTLKSGDELAIPDNWVGDANDQIWRIRFEFSVNLWKGNDQVTNIEFLLP